MKAQCCCLKKKKKKKVSGLTDGYHLLRAFLVDGESGEVIKSSDAYVEAEFFVNRPYSSNIERSYFCLI